MKKTLVVSSIVGVVVIGAVAQSYFFPEAPDWVTTTIEAGDVRETVAVSGFVEAKNQAELAFPASGVVTGVLVEEGDLVEAGDILATLGSSELVAERAQAASALARVQASYSGLVSGPRSETVAVAATAVENAKANLTRTTTEANQKIKNAKAALLSTGLEAAAIDINENAIPPTVSGTYTCAAEGTYTIEVYSSAARSGVSFNYTGPESGNGNVSFDQPSPLGNCGLYLSFTTDEVYSQSDWLIEVPNTRSSSYTTLKNAYELAKTEAEGDIKAAADALALAEKESALSTAPARSTELNESSATVREYESRLAAIDAKLRDRSIVAPFAGIITETEIVVGETSPNTPVITLLASDVFTLTARIPEIDITKLALAEKVEAIFDAKSDETLTGSISYISPIATQIDGVAYFETTIDLDNIPTWLRGGLNADVDIIVKEKKDVLRLPKRFIINTEAGPVVLTPNRNQTATTSITVDFTGNDSYVAVSGLPAGTTVVAP